MQWRHPYVRFFYFIETKSGLSIVTNLDSWFVLSEILRCSLSVLVLFSLLRCGAYDSFFDSIFFVRVVVVSRQSYGFLFLVLRAETISFSFSQMTKNRSLCASKFQSQFCFSLGSLSKKCVSAAYFAFELSVRFVIDGLRVEQSLGSTRTLKPLDFRYLRKLSFREMLLVSVTLCVSTSLFFASHVVCR